MATELERRIASRKDDGDRHWRFDEWVPALEAYVDAVRSTGVAECAIPTLLEAAGTSAGEGRHSVAMALVSTVLAIDPHHADANALLLTATAPICASAGSPAPQCIGEMMSRQAVDATVRAGFEFFVATGAWQWPSSGSVMTPPPPAVLGNAFSNLALCATGLRLWPQCLTAAIAAVVFNPSLREKNAARYAVAAAHLGVHGLQVGADDKLDAVVAATIASIQREQRGEFDWRRLSKGGDATPIAEYRAPIDVKMTAHCGFGLFATRPIAAGGLVLCEHAVGYTTVSEASGGKDFTVSRLESMARLPCCGFLMERVARVYDGTTRTLAELDKEDFRGICEGWTLRHPLVLDDAAFGALSHQTRTHLDGAVRLNAYTGEHYVEQPRTDWAAIGLYPTGAFLNHSATPNTVCQTIGRFFVVRAAVPIAEGEEILGTYVPSSRYLSEDQPLQRWEIVVSDRPASVTQLRALFDKLGASADKLLAYHEGLPLLSSVEAPCRRAFIADAGLFAAMAKQDTHAALAALEAMLANPGDIDLSVLEQVARVTRRHGSKMSKAVRARLEKAVVPWCLTALGHDNTVAASRV